MRSVLVLFLATFATMGFGCTLFFQKAMAQTEVQRAMDMSEHNHSDGHAEFHDVYRTWCQPGYPKPCEYIKSCCAARRVLQDGSMTGDCLPTEAELRASADKRTTGLVWWAKDQHGNWIEVPEDKVVHEINPDDSGTRAHLCQNQYSDNIFCFVPPTGGS